MSDEGQRVAGVAIVNGAAVEVQHGVEGADKGLDGGVGVDEGVGSQHHVGGRGGVVADGADVVFALGGVDGRLHGFSRHVGHQDAETAIVQVEHVVVVAAHLLGGQVAVPHVEVGLAQLHLRQEVLLHQLGDSALVLIVLRIVHGHGALAGEGHEHVDLVVFPVARLLRVDGDGAEALPAHPQGGAQHAAETFLGLGIGVFQAGRGGDILHVGRNAAHRHVTDEAVAQLAANLVVETRPQVAGGAHPQDVVAVIEKEHGTGV